MNMQAAEIFSTRRVTHERAYEMNEEVIRLVTEGTMNPEHRASKNYKAHSGQGKQTSNYILCLPSLSSSPIQLFI